MPATHIALLVLIGATPLLLFGNDGLVSCLIDLFAAAGLMSVALSLRRGGATHLSKCLSVPVAAALLPLLWMLIQLLPLPLGSFSKSIWDSTASVLSPVPFAHPTIDIGRTFISTVFYAALIATMVVAAESAIERRQAEELFIALTGATVVTAAIRIVHDWGGFTFLGEINADGPRPAIATAASLGTVLSGAIGILIIERWQTRRSDRSLAHLLAQLGATSVALLVCILSITLDDSRQAMAMAAFGLTTVAIIYFVRRIGLGFRAALVMEAFAAGAMTLLIAMEGSNAGSAIALRYAAPAQLEPLAVISRILETPSIVGSGAGTMDIMYRIYGVSADAGIRHAPTLASQIVVELGWPLLWAAVLMALGFILLCFRGAFDRGRDFFYPAAGAGIGTVAIMSLFCSNSLREPAILVILAASSGLSLAQSQRRTF